jgi:hypothetical protein
MRTSIYLLLAVLLCVLGAGCASDDLTERIVEIKAAQVEGDSSSHDGLSASDATNILHEVKSRLASRLGYTVFENKYPNPNNIGTVEYSIHFTQQGASTVGITLDMDGKHVIFRGDTDADAPSEAELQKAMKVVQGVLDERGIRYRVRSFTEQEYLIPSQKKRMLN